MCPVQICERLKKRSLFTFAHTFDFADNSELLSLCLARALVMMKSPILQQQGRRNVSRADLRTPQKNKNCSEFSNADSPSIAQLIMKLNEAGILSKKEVRALLFNQQVLPQKKSRTNTPPPKKSRTTTPPPKKHHQPRPPLDFSESQYQEDFSESQQSQDFSESQTQSDFSESQSQDSHVPRLQRVPVPVPVKEKTFSLCKSDDYSDQNDCTWHRFFDECIKPDSLF